MKKIVLIVALLCSVLWLQPALAQGLKSATGMLDKIGGANGEKLGVSADLGTSIATVIKTILALVGTIFLILTIYAGIMWMTAQGEDEKVTKALNMIRSAIVGLVIVMSAYAITYFVTSKLAGINPQPSPSVVDQNNTSDNTEMGCCYNQSSGRSTASTHSLCSGFQEIWSSGSCNTNETDNTEMGCCYNQSSGRSTASTHSLCSGFQEIWSSGSCETQIGCCHNQSSGRDIASTHALCNGSQEQWTPGPCP